MQKSKLAALLSLCLVFLSGALVGVVAYRLYTVKAVATGAAVIPAQRPPNPEEIRKRLISEMRDRVKLDDQQVQQLNRIYDETRQSFDELHKKANAETRALWDKQTEEIKAMLQPGQLALYDKLRAERDAERRKRREQQQQKGGGPPPPPRQ